MFRVVPLGEPDKASDDVVHRTLDTDIVTADALGFDSVDVLDRVRRVRETSLVELELTIEVSC